MRNESRVLDKNSLKEVFSGRRMECVYFIHDNPDKDYLIVDNYVDICCPQCGELLGEMPNTKRDKAWHNQAQKLEKSCQCHFLVLDEVEAPEAKTTGEAPVRRERKTRVAKKERG